MSLIVMKFGGNAVADLSRIKSAAGKVAAEVRQGNNVAVVVSAMEGVTDQLVGYCRGISPLHSPRERDVVIAAGEQITSGLMVMALEQRGLRARSWQGWQVPVRTDADHNNAKICNINSAILRCRIENGEIGVLAGAQGISDDGSITSLGRSGDDASAVALAVSMEADRCDIYSDVDGIYTCDPRIVRNARKLSSISYGEMLEMAALGTKILQVRAVELAMRSKITLQVLSTFDNAIGSDLLGTLVVSEDKTMERSRVTGVAHSINEARITLIKLPDSPGVAASVFTPLARAGINIDMIVQTAYNAGRETDITFTVGRADLDRVVQILNNEKEQLKFAEMQTAINVSKISLVGLGMRGHSGVASLMFEILASNNINIQAIETSEISVSVLIAEEYTELALRVLHTAYGLDQVEETKK